MAKVPERTPLPGAEHTFDLSEELAREIADQIGPLVSKGTRDQIVARVVRVTQSEMFQGPIAHPKHLAQYEETLPGSADRIIRMAESQLEHSQKMQERVLDAEIGDQKSGRLYGFLALLSLIIASAVTGALGMQALSLAFLGTGVLGVVGAFIRGRASPPPSE